MPKILYLLLLVSVASFGQSDKVKPYATTCFTLNDSVSIFKLTEFVDSVIEKKYIYRIKKKYNGKKIELAGVGVQEEVIKESDSNDIKIFVERTIKSILKEDKSAKLKKFTHTIRDKYEGYKLEITFKIHTRDMLASIYIFQCENSFITLALSMQKTKDSPYYLQEFNKLVNTIKFK